MTLCTETRHAVRNCMLLEITANLLRIAEHLEHADPAVDQDLRLLLETAQHAAGRVRRNTDQILSTVLPLSTVDRAPAVERAAAPAGAASKDYENAGKRIADILQQKYGAEGVTVEKLR